MYEFGGTNLKFMLSKLNKYHFNISARMDHMYSTSMMVMEI